MKRVMNFFLLSCKVATGLMSKKEVINLTLIESIQLKMHTSMCRACSAFEKQSETIEKTLSKLSEEQVIEKQILTSDFKKELLDKIKKSK